MIIGLAWFSKGSLQPRRSFRWNYRFQRISGRFAISLSLIIVSSLTITGCVAGVSEHSSKPVANAFVGEYPAKIKLDALPVRDMKTRTAGASPTAATWQYISGAEAFNSRLDARLLSILDLRAGGRHEPLALADPAAPLLDGYSVTHELVMATGTTVGSRLRQAIVRQGRMTERAEDITYEDLSTGMVSGSASLISPEMLGALREMMYEVPAPATSVKASQTPESTAQSTKPASPQPLADAEMLSAVTFTSSGDLSVTVNKDPATGEDLDESFTVTLGTAATEKVLSPAGQALRRSLLAGSSFAGPVPSTGGAEHINCDIVACAALTYDDGPNAQTTRLLEILDRHHVSATFFQQGGYVNSNPQISKAVAAAGHTIANHTMTHPYLTNLSAAAAAKEINGAQSAIEKAAGVTPAYLRPPYGATNAGVAAIAGLPQVTWDVDSMDWQSRNKAVFIPRIMSLVKPGSVILQHDIHATTVDGQEELITQLSNRGYYLVTVPQLFAGIDLKPGGIYKCRGTAPGCTRGR